MGLQIHFIKYLCIDFAACFHIDFEKLFENIDSALIGDHQGHLKKLSLPSVKAKANNCSLLISSNQYYLHSFRKFQYFLQNISSNSHKQCNDNESL